MKGACNVWLCSFLCVIVCVQFYGVRGNDYLEQLIKARKTRTVNYVSDEDSSFEYHISDEDSSSGYRPVYVEKNQDGLKEADKISSLPGQPQVNFSQYSGYVTVDPHAGRALFYYFTESAQDSATKPLVLWLNGGPGCSSLGGAMMELGPFRVNPDGKSLWLNKNSWNNEANIVFLESPAGVGFSYSNSTSDYTTGDKKTAADAYTFLVNWLERFPEYKTRDFYLTGESYAGHYVPQLAKLILKNNKITNQTVINLKGIAIGNALIDDDDESKGAADYFWTHAITWDREGSSDIGNIYGYDIYAPLCSSPPSTFPSISTFDPCSRFYLYTYFNTPEVQKALHAHVDGPWVKCSDKIKWLDWESTLLPTIKGLMASGIRVWIYSGDTDSVVPVTATRYSLTRIAAPVKTKWYPWYVQGEVGGYAVGYENITFVTVRGAGHFVPSYQPERALVMFSSFIQGKLPPRVNHK